jgi:hypothetical protein
MLFFMHLFGFELRQIPMDHITQTAFSIDSTLGELPSIDSSIDHQTTGETVFKMFHNDPANPGVIVMEDGVISGLISREAFFENTGKRFGIEVFLGRPISAMLEQYSTQPLILPANAKVSLAIHEALKRRSRTVYDPIIVEKQEKQYRVIDILTVFLAENQILLTLHNQHAFTVASGIKLTDEEAIKRFIQFTGLISIKDPKVLINRNTVICDRCGSSVEYSIADVVRSHPQLNRGVEVTSKMGTRSYILYVRHTCGTDIREIPVYHDGELNLRALRPSRLVETYV